MTQLPALAVLAVVLLLAAVMYAVARARGRYGIKAPAITGHPAFEAIFRVQANTVESVVMFLPTLWLAARYSNPTLAGALGLLWVLARAWYAVAYARRPASREAPFVVASLLWVVLLVMALVGVIRALMIAP
ncbi:MAPEG family protein [Oleiagrimonas sp. C23AA]|nr:MAPEG family protein [Oleiagrimonas sp. C23AA]